MNKKRGLWTEENMKKAINDVRSGILRIREASERYSVPKSTLGDRLKSIGTGNELQIKPSLGYFQSTFTEEQDQELYNHIKILDSQLMPLNKNEFLKLVFQFAEELKIHNQFNKDKRMAGKDFYYQFMKRHPDLSLRSAESTSLQRATGFNKQQVDLFYDKLTALLTKFSFSPSRIFNADETGVSMVHKNQLKVMTLKGKKTSGKVNIR